MEYAFVPFSSDTGKAAEHQRFDAQTAYDAEVRPRPIVLIWLPRRYGFANIPRSFAQYEKFKFGALAYSLFVYE